MNKRFIRTASPLGIAGIICFDVLSLAAASLSVKLLIDKASFYTVSFAVIMAVDIVSAALATRYVLKSGVMLYSDRIEFTRHDSEKYYFRDIESVQTYKDAKASLKKRFVERYSSIILHLKDGTTATVELGYTTKRKLKMIEAAIREAIYN